MAWDRVRDSYDRVASTYQTRFLDELAAKPRDRQLLEQLAAAVGDPVLDIGCGPGQIGAFVRAQGRAVVGIDFSARMAALAAGRLDGAVVGDMRALPFASASIGAVVAFYSLIHLRRHELGPVLDELRRVVGPGGRILFSAHEGRGEVELEEFIGEQVPMAASWFELDELVAGAETAGFQVLRAERRQPYSDEGATVRLYVEAQAEGR